MSGYVAHLKNLPFTYKRLVRIFKWMPLLILIVLLGKWPALVSGSGGWPISESRFDGDVQLFMNLEMTLMGLAVLGGLTWWNVGPRWLSLLRPAVAIGIPVAMAILLITFGTAFAVNPEVLHHELRAINPLEQPQAWLVPMATLLLGVLQQEIWGRALLQSTLQRMFGNRWIALALAALLLAADQPGRRLDAFFAAVLLGVVFIRTRSIVCTTVIHAVLNLAVGVLQGGLFMAAPLLDLDQFRAMRPAISLGPLLLALGVELWYRRSTRGSHPVKTFTKNLLVFIFAFGLIALTSTLSRPLWIEFEKHHEWLSPHMSRALAWMVSGGITVTVLACLRCGPSWRTLLAIHPRVTLSLAMAVAVMPPLTAAIAMPEAFRIAQFDPLPLDQLPQPILQVITGSSCEEVSDRAFMQSQLSKLFFSKWAGALVSGWGFAMSHPPERMAIVLPAALLLVVVFMRTGSIFCTSVLHTTMNASYGLVCLTNFTRSPFIPYETFNAANPLFGGMLVALTIAFEWCWRRSERARTGRLAPPPNERIPGFDPASLSP